MAAKKPEFHIPIDDILDSLFNKGGGQDSTNTLVNHQIESFNEFLDKQLIQIIQGFNPIQVCHNYCPILGDFKYKIQLNILQPSLTKPIYQTVDGTQILMTPNLSRMNNLTYASNLYVDVHVITNIINENNITERKENTVHGVCIGKIPIMVRSKACMLTQLPGLAEINKLSECRYDLGGYFIVNGNEKVIISQDRISENRTVVFAPNSNGDGLSVEIRSMPDGIFLPPKTTNLHLSGKANHMGNLIRLNASFLKSDVPLFVMFRALGIVSDKEIYSHIVLDIDAIKNERMLTQLAACAEDACHIHTQEEALNYILKFLGTTGTPKEYLDQHDRSIDILKNTIRNDFLAHVGHSFHKKALYLGYMVRKLLSIHLGYQDFDNRDSYLYKRIDTPGILFSNLFRQCYGKLIKEMRNLIVRELNIWRANTNSSIQLITQNNVHRFFKQIIIETGLRYALSTGNWGVKSIGSFQNIKQGVAQVLNRMSYLSTLSHLRRINTPMEKNGKLVQPRKLENTQFGMICPSETPEGAAVGLVKNIALSTHITVNVSSIYVRQVLEELGTKIYDDNNKSRLKFLKEMGDINNVQIMINGDLIGFHSDPDKLYNQLKHLKRHGTIPPVTSIIWEIQKNIIKLSTEAGRMCRPLLIVDNGEIRIFKMLKERGITWKEFSEGKTFQQFIAPLEDDFTEGFIEYLDVDEIDNSMIAMFPEDLKRGVKGTTLPPIFTHCEISPSLLNGVLAANIPFMDHNQAPRNCYQCLFEEEYVKMSDGSSKQIKNVRVGDSVLCFNPKTMLLENTKVVHQYVRRPSNPVYKITVASGRTIIATNNHKFMTNQGWKNLREFDDYTKLGIYYTPRTLSNIPIVPVNQIDNISYSIDEIELTTGVCERLISYGIMPLYNTSDLLPIIARIMGYMYDSKSFGFASSYDESKFKNDVKMLGFTEYDYHDNAFMMYMLYLGAFTKTVPKWINNCSPLVKREYCSGYMGNYTRTHSNYMISNNGNNINQDPDISNLINEIYSSGKKTKYPTYNYMENISYAYNQCQYSQDSLVAEYEKYQQYYLIKPEDKDIEYENWISKYSIEICGDVMWIHHTKSELMTSVMISDITVESDYHSFIGGDGFTVSNSAMGKQAVGIYMSNFNNRIDTLGHVLHYPQTPLVRTKLSKYTYSDSLPSGINAVVAIATHTGFNQEDSVMINQSAIDRGLLTSTYYKSYREQCSKNHSTGEEEIFTKPIVETSSKVKAFNYDKLDENGFVPNNTFVDSNDIIVGKVMPTKIQGALSCRDTSLQLKKNDEGYIDHTYQGINGEGYKFAKIRLRKYRKPVIGDKVASRMAQKGTIGMVYKQQDMPFSKSGITPDIIMNPHAIPSRMTIGQLMECIMGKACCHLGTRGDATPFTDCSVESIAEILEKSGYERYGNEILYNGRTGEQIQTEIFIGPTYYQRLKHMVYDKVHCLTADHTVLCKDGWKPIASVIFTDEVAILKDGKLVYENPLDIYHYPEFEGEMYHISNEAVDLDVTMNHRMYVSTSKSDNYELVKAEDIIGKSVKYKHDCDRDIQDYQFILPEVNNETAKKFDMDSWITFFGIWIVEGLAYNGNDLSNYIEFAIDKPYVKDVLFDAIEKMGYDYQKYNEKLSICDEQLYTYMASLSVDASSKRLPKWVWDLSKHQSQQLVTTMQLDKNVDVYYTSSNGLADDFQKLCIHAGWTSIKNVLNDNLWKITVIKSQSQDNSIVNLDREDHNILKTQEEYTYHYTGSVYCLKVSSSVFMVRKNGKAVWTGNSRGSNGPVVMLTRQPAEGRARDGGLRFGEMERDAILGHGASNFLKERMLDVSDNFRIFVCRKCGLIATANPEKNIFKCSGCKNNADITQVRIPYSMKLLMQELMTMSVAPRIMV